MTQPYRPFEGVYPAMTTPFRPDDSIDFEQLRDDARRLETAGVDGLVPVGSTGESATLSHDEHVEVVEAVAETVDVPVIAGAGSNATREALDLARRSADAGADGLLLISPYYNRPEPEGMERHYRAVADAVDLPQIVYNVPSRTGRNIPVDVAASLASHDNVVGYKAASGDLDRIGEVIERTRDEEFAVLSGDDYLTLPLLAMGAAGAISVAANVEPERVTAMVEAARAGDVGEARTVHEELAPLVRALFAETNPVPVKEAMDVRGYGPAHLRSPLTRASEDRRAELAGILETLDEEASQVRP